MQTATVAFAAYLAAALACLVLALAAGFATARGLRTAPRLWSGAALAMGLACMAAGVLCNCAASNAYHAWEAADVLRVVGVLLAAAAATALAAPYVLGVASVLAPHPRGRAANARRIRAALAYHTCKGG